ncbi:tetratricopeptide repeat protein [Azospirillum brasilense]|uniref:Methyltransferase domain-containing protein n=1 Tax=Azospirillum brasilense TaxID=192 RepID=A0A6L3B162_AZOBR|nr:tetratricopeptide repeat protein [Azospirillum brasilense]KAA0685910.1 methyltransferase domain-containing protein [Azospirillum brasilense]
MDRDSTAQADREGAGPLVQPGDVPGILFQTGYDRLYAADAAGAARAFRLACAADPGSGEAWGALADSARDAGEAAGALAACGRAVALDPGVWPWRVALAEALHTAGRFEEAVTTGQVLTAERPDSATARLGLARALAAAGRRDAALEEYREAVALRPGDREAALELAALLVETGDALGAVELLQPLSRRDPEDADLHAAIGRAWIALQDPAKALTALRRAQGLDPDGRLGCAALITALDSGAGEHLSAAYVRALFDRYADRFDQDLVGKLDYSAPALLREAVDRLGPVSGLRVLDLGCGTGLAGVAFRPLAGHLAGVDLAPRMVEKARARALYDELSVGDVAAAVEAAPGAWDLLVAADVLVYLGNLTALFEGAAKALRPAGRFAATVERLDGEAAASGYALGPSRRYAHSEAYLREMAAAAGLTVLLMEPCSPRREKGVGVPGLLFIVEKPAA